MNAIVKQALGVLLGLSLLATAALAKGEKQFKNKTVTFDSDLMVQGTMVHKGTYELRFDEKNNELAILSGRKDVVTVPVHLEKRPAKVQSTEIISEQKGGQNLLDGVVFGGSDETIMINKQKMQSNKGN
jgi:hypothetical protein